MRVRHNETCYQRRPEKSACTVPRISNRLFTLFASSHVGPDGDASSHVQEIILYMVLGDAVSALETFVRIFKTMFQGLYLDLCSPQKYETQMTNLNVIFHVVVSVYR